MCEFMYIFTYMHIYMCVWFENWRWVEGEEGLEPDVYSYMHVFMCVCVRCSVGVCVMVRTLEVGGRG